MVLRLHATGIVKSYPVAGVEAVHILRGIDLEIGQGESIAIMGPSGAGKSTLLHILAGLDKPDNGEVTFYTSSREFRYSTLKESELAALRSESIGFVFQFHYLIPECSAIENVMLPLLIRGARTVAARARAGEYLERFGMSNRADYRPATLSGGEQQRIAIARALVHDPVMLFADEPTGNLDTSNADAVREVFEELRSNTGLSWIVATHSADVASVARYKMNMRDGLIEVNGK